MAVGGLLLALSNALPSLLKWITGTAKDVFDVAKEVLKVIWTFIKDFVDITAKTINLFFSWYYSNPMPATLLLGILFISTVALDATAYLAPDYCLKAGDDCITIGVHSAIVGGATEEPVRIALGSRDVLKQVSRVKVVNVNFTDTLCTKAEGYLKIEQGKEEGCCIWEGNQLGGDDTSPFGVPFTPLYTPYDSPSSFSPLTKYDYPVRICHATNNLTDANNYYYPSSYTNYTLTNEELLTNQILKFIGGDDAPVTFCADNQIMQEYAGTDCWIVRNETNYQRMSFNTTKHLLLSNPEELGKDRRIHGLAGFLISIDNAITGFFEGLISWSKDIPVDQFSSGFGGIFGLILSLYKFFSMIMGMLFVLLYVGWILLIVYGVMHIFLI